MRPVIFEEETHTYRWADTGEELPSVTRILNEWVRVTMGGNDYHVNVFTGVRVLSSQMEAGADNGTGIHLGCHILATGGDLDWDALHDELKMPLRKFKEWLTDYNVEVEGSEILVASEEYQYAGTLDLKATVLGKPWYLDIKSGVTYEPTVAAQLSGYQRADMERSGGPQRQIGALIPPKTESGSWKIKRLNFAIGDRLFMNRLELHNILRR